MAKKKTLSEELADFMKPQSFDYDIEDSERIADKNNDEEEESESEDDDLKKEHYVTVGKSKIRSNDMKVDDPKYQGSYVSRKDLESEENHDLTNRAADIQSEDESEDDQSKDNEQNGNVDQDESDSAVDLSDASSDEFEASEDELGEEQEVNQYKRDKIKELMSKQAHSAASRVVDSAQIDALKGFHVIQQQSLYDAILDSRIKLQKGLATYNQFPHSETAIKEYSTAKTTKYLKKTQSSLFSLADALLELRLALLKKDKVVNKDKERSAKKRSLDSYLEETQNLDSTLNAYRTAVLTKWSQKVQSASGSAALNASKFKAINQTAAVQVENNLANMDRLVKRTKLNRRQTKPLGYKSQQSEEDAKKKNSFDPSLQENENIFDDEDFYRLLLRDLIDKKVNSSALGGENNIILTKSKFKLKKNVDTKASKGRKLNYKVQEPLQNYMAPKFDKSRWSDYQIDEFFAGLLGRKINMNEDEEDVVPEAEQYNDDEQSEAILNDDIQLFA